MGTPPAAQPEAKPAVVSVAEAMVRPVGKHFGAEEMELEVESGLLLPRFWLADAKAIPADLDERKEMVPGSFADLSAFPSILLQLVSLSNATACRATLENAFERALFSHRVKVSIVQRVPGCDTPALSCSAQPAQALCMHASRIRSFTLPPGAGGGGAAGEGGGGAAASGVRRGGGLASSSAFLRHVGSRMFRGEAFVLEVGAETARFHAHWDTEVLRQWRATGNEYAVLTAGLSPPKHYLNPQGFLMRRETPSRTPCAAAAWSAAGGAGAKGMRLTAPVPAEAKALNADEPLLTPGWAAGFAFGRGHRLVRAPHLAATELIVNDGAGGAAPVSATVATALSLWTHGYDLYAPTTPVVFGVEAEETGGGEGRRPALDAGRARPVRQWLQLFGLNLRKRTADYEGLCEWVRLGLMHQDFRPHLRKDGKGIDYSRLFFYEFAPRLTRAKLISPPPPPAPDVKLDPYAIRRRYLLLSMNSTATADECGALRRQNTCYRVASGNPKWCAILGADQKACGCPTPAADAPPSHDSLLLDKMVFAPLQKSLPSAPLPPLADPSGGAPLPSMAAPRVLCVGFTISKNHQTHMRASAETWMPHCDGALVLSDTSDETLPAVAVAHKGPEVYNNVWQKTRANWRYIHRHFIDDFDFFVYGGDDYYILVDNLRHFLGSPEVRLKHQRGKGIYAGRPFKITTQHFSPATHFNSGGPGYILNNKALRLFVEHMDEPVCTPDFFDSREDVWISHCLFMNGVPHHDTRDETAHDRFHPFWPSHHLLYDESMARHDWYGNDAVGLRFGFDCCSDRSVGFHYIKQYDMRRIHRVLQCSRQFGLRVKLTRPDGQWIPIPAPRVMTELRPELRPYPENT